MLCLLLHFGNASFWFIVISILKLNPRFCKSGDTTYCLACYMLQCLGTIHLAALRPHCRMFLHSPSPLRSFFNISPYQDYSFSLKPRSFSCKYNNNILIYSYNYQTTECRYLKIYAEWNMKRVENRCTERRGGCKLHLSLTSEAR